VATKVRPRRQRSIRALLALIFIVPLASLLGLWGFAASVTASNAIQEHNSNNENQTFGGSAQNLLTQLAQERLLSYEWLSSGGQGPGEAPLLNQQRATDVAATNLQKGLERDMSRLAPAALPELRNLSAQLASLNGIRASVDVRHITELTAFSDYNAVVDAAFYLYGALVVVNNTPLYLQAAASIEAGRSVELASREATLISGAIYAHGLMTKAERTVFAQTAASRQLLMTDALRQLNVTCGSGFRRAQASAAYRSFMGLENQITASIGNQGPLPISPLAFAAAALPLFKQYQTAEAQDRMELSNFYTQIGNQLLEKVALAGGVGLVAVALSLFLMLRFGRRITRDLTGLQHAALDLALNRLPHVISRLSQGEDVDVAAEAAPIAGGRIAETARVADAFSSVQRTAVEAAVGQARLRRGVSRVFRNLAWRSQSLLHRQLTLLDAMERRQAEPEMLDELFQLDHLTTRMRRHAEGLIILSGAVPGRGWREPVPVMDVLRGAIAEVEEYKRVTVLSDSRDEIVGTAVADLIHLLAELIENATTFSPPSTEVTVRAERVANGFVAEIEDRGIGIDTEQLATFNERLANPPEFDLADSNQLGLFVVARLSSKHHITVTLRRSPYGGTTAIVLLPSSTVVLRGKQDTKAFDVFRIRTAGTGGHLAAPPASPSPGAPWGASPAIASAAVAPGANGQVPDGVAPAGGLNLSPKESPALAVGRLAPASSDPSAGRHEAPWERAALGSPWEPNSAAPARDGAHGGFVPALGTAPPPLPRRHRRASLAPQLRNDGLAAEAQLDSQESPSPEATRALVESLQNGLDLGMTTSTSGGDSRPAAGITGSASSGEDTEDL
jgi:signal transduction histidine kinase